ncbi:MAG TPA: glycine zipper 2TM domain-containing protein, partial [Steroidobacteraceae bacterium]|nr:glycine zipper 2TM domain-containing protein [Steroidobacteraceae bacterium]
KPIWSISVAMMCAAVLSGCATPPPRHTRIEPPAPPSMQDVYVYPNNGQSEAQADRDRYECHQWAVKQSRFDPSLARNVEAPRVHVEGPPPGAGTAAGAVTGAVIGAAVSGPYHGPGGAIVGAMAGAIIGSAADEAREERAEQVQREYNRGYAAQLRPAQDYRRAISACLEGRGYTVK